MWPGMAPDKYWNNLDWLTYLYTESPMAAKVVSCNSMGVGCCSAAANDKRVVTPQQQTKCWELGDAPSGGDRTTAGSVTGHFCEPDAPRLPCRDDSLRAVLLSRVLLRRQTQTR